MKKTTAVLAAMFLGAAMIFPVHADENLQVTYEVPNTYTVTIPASVTLDNSPRDVNISAKYDIEPGKKLKVKVNRGISNNEITLSRDGDTATTVKANVSAKIGNTAINTVTANTVLAEFSGYSTASVTGGMISISKPSGAKAGTYSGTVVFSVIVE